MPSNPELVERLIRAFEEGDVDGALSCLDPEVELLPIRARLEGTDYRGHDGWRKMVADFEEDWEGLRLVHEELREADDRVVATGHITARGRASGVELDVPLALLYEIRDGLIVRVESFAEAEEALRAAGLGQ